MKEAHGVNFTSAYCLVYAQKQVLMPGKGPIRNHYLSHEEGYLNSLTGSYLNKDCLELVRKDNYSLLNDIEQYKMGHLANKVLDAYTKNFEQCNEVFRKSQQDKKSKHIPPVIINLPTFVKNLSEEDYKAVLMEYEIKQHGPKEDNPLFRELLHKKMGNLN